MFSRVVQVVPARGQWDPYYRWKPHHNCKVEDLKKHYDPARTKREAEEKEKTQEEVKAIVTGGLLLASATEEAKALEIAASMSDATAAAFIGAIAGLALTPTTRRRIIDDYEEGK